MMPSCKTWSVLHMNEGQETSRVVMPAETEVGSELPPTCSVSPTLAWQLSKLIDFDNQLHTLTSERLSERERLL